MVSDDQFINTAELFLPLAGTIITVVIVGSFGWYLQRQLLRHQEYTRKRESMVGFVSKYRRYEVFVRPSDGVHFVDPEQFGADLTNVVMWTVGLESQLYVNYVMTPSEVDFRELLENIAESVHVPLGPIQSFFPWSCRIQDNPQPGMIVPRVHFPDESPNIRFHVEDCPGSPYYQPPPTT